ncbi:hypothetical protein IFM89_012959 [Coptis chinensis]|uniref:Radical SAM core domain-containing protein n=1 Tax=Coptis chinensis TaxID=261450 RepID=A0A835LR33_9MAGN|nr:hypothetical protein IFM89_012959 [Coptis chinensis]
MEFGCCMWMRRTGTYCFLLINKPFSSPLNKIPFFFPSLKPHSLSLLSLSSHTNTFSSLSSTSLGHGVSPPPSSPVPVNKNKVLLKGMTYTELEKWVQSIGFRPGQAMMLWKQLYGHGIWAHSSDELEGLNKDFRKALSDLAEFKALSLKDILTAADGTRKILFTLDDGLVIETVVIPCKKGRTTVCVSSQVGCAMNCQFCYTGRMGLKRHLTAAEIIEQTVFVRRVLSGGVGSISNVVFMGMGEPLHNIDSVIKAANIMVDEQGLQFSPRKVTISTSGLVPQLKRFLNESNCSLAVSLNATTNEVRNWIMPINRKYKLEMLLGTLREELSRKHNYKVLFEYVMLAGINDSIDDAKRLIVLVQGIPCKVNLITFNPHCGSQFKPTSDDKMIEFRNVLAEAGCVVLLRPSRGDDQMAACGQLGKPGELQPPRLRVPARFQVAV